MRQAPVHDGAGRGPCEAVDEPRQREPAGRTAGPGIMDLLMVYGGYEEALEQAEAYLRVSDSVPMSSSSDSSAAPSDDFELVPRPAAE